MIIAKIRRKTPSRRQTAGSEFAYVARLSRYIVRADLEDLRKLRLHEDNAHIRDLLTYTVEEQVLASGAIGLMGKNLEAQQVEMMGLMHRCENGAGALDHWVMSWAADDKPTVEQIEKSTHIFLHCQDLENCPVIWGVHGDTDNLHVHIAVLRIDCVTAERRTAGNGWDIDTAQRAKAVIENTFPHWSREEGSLYEVAAGVLVHKADNAEIGPADNPRLWKKSGVGRVGSQSKTASKSRDVAARIDEASRRYEEESGYKSRQRIALETAVPIALKSSCWDECNRLLAAEGISIENVRKGANFIIDGKRVKASIDRSTSYEKLKTRYGNEEFTPSAHPIKPTPQREMWSHDLKRREYYASKRDHENRLSSIVDRFREGHGRAASGGVSADAVATAKASAKFPSFDDWAGGTQPADPVEAVASALGFGIIEVSPLNGNAPQQEPIETFTAVKLSGRVIYRRADDPAGRPSFIDLGDRVLVNAAKDRGAVRAALLLVAKNNPGCEIAVFGDRAFKKLALELAMQEGIALHGALGRQQAKIQRTDEAPKAEANRQRPPTPVQPQQPFASPSARRAPIQSTVQHRPHTAPTTPRPSGPSIGRDALQALVARIFHSNAWDPAEFWPDSMLGNLNSGIPSAIRRFNQIRSVTQPLPVDDTPLGDTTGEAQRKASDAAYRAAAIAAAARGF
ncbi:relaxase/mobilization nuclease domain-containing protein [Erythrobacter sp.]|uniref:relaxase/mobilization nuclease domain-containing protein n=1 Tax=Erythrobacter sp. TaxID=1042 RepID=UPI0025FA0FCB|nr:relaxase/mobilization nuclease domain-containing protein [Erythrobacter sp.]